MPSDLLGLIEAVQGSHLFAPDCAPLRRLGVFGWKARPVSERVASMSMDTELQKHYALLLGIGSPWEVKTVELSKGSSKGSYRIFVHFSPRPQDLPAFGSP